MRRSLLTAALSFSLTGCATIMHGTQQDIGFSSNPSSARLLVDGQPKGVTPAVVKLARKSSHVVRMELDGYKPFEATITKSASGWVWGNIVFGGLIGLAVDAASGGLYKLSPEQVAGQMANAQTGAVTRDGIFVRVVMSPDASWEKIGQLTRE